MSLPAATIFPFDWIVTPAAKASPANGAPRPKGGIEGSIR